MGFKDYFQAINPHAPTANSTTRPALDIPVDKVNQQPRRPPLGYGMSNFTTPAASSMQSSYPPSIASSNMMEDIKHEVMVNYLYQQQCSNMWVQDMSGEHEGILLRKSRNNYMACPPELGHSRFAIACAALNVPVAMTVSSRVIKTFLQWSPDALDVPLTNSLRIQVLPTIDDLPKARKHQFAAFIAQEQYLVVWDDDALNIHKRAKSIEGELMELVWRTHEEVQMNEKKDPAQVAVEELDEESGEVTLESRPTHLQNSVLVALSLTLLTVVIGAGYRELAIEIAIDHDWTRLAFIALTPAQLFLSVFFMQVIVGCLAQIFGPIRQLTQNSKYFSAKPPARVRSAILPHVTIQCPVYKEGLHAVIAPTVKSVKQAISTYELQGGSANIFINDDGLQIIDEEDRQARIEFYADNNIGWTARPKDGLDGFIRRGKFKKASNMNYGLNMSCKIEEKLAALQRSDEWGQNDEAAAYEDALREVVIESKVGWADGNIRMGDYIILIDSDTQVPADCFLDAVSELERSPEVGIMQYSSGVMQVVHNYFENGVTFFTNMIYTAIRYTVSNGDVAPFVGHNAILRWSAIQQISYEDGLDGYEKFWSESHVSEDFDMSLRLQILGYTIRMAAFAGDGFKEGVSLTVYDELARWEKYAYGCNELLFHPLRYWLWKGPFTKLCRTFLFSNIRMTSKITILSYIGTYYAIAAAWFLTLFNYFAIGWYNGYLDKYYIDSWKVWVAILVVFNGLGNLALATMRYRIGERSFFWSLLENIKWIPMLAIFLGGLSLHVSQAILAHFFSVNMTWGATAKELEYSNFFIEVPKVLKNFKYSMIFSLGIIITMVILATASFVPWDWQIKDFVAILPMSAVATSHFLLPIALNPALMTFSF